MDHEAVVRQKMTERYLLNELDPKTRDEFEEHFFDCQDCAQDVHAGALFIEQTKVVLAEKAEPVSVGLAVPVPGQVKPGWMWWLRPALVVPVMAMLLTVVAYQNLFTLPRMEQAMNRPQVLPWAPVNVGTFGSEGPVIAARPGQGFLLFVRIPPEGVYSRYTAELYNPAGRVEWSVTIPASSTQDQWPVQVPGANRQAGNYSLAVRGVTAAGDSKEVGRASFELQIQK
ncbi:MAG: zf-HC2 domain-containing protein [Acidobacteriia bacterium]|nr:zf-HC2 domain-containing protein [Terriglobia bacterium]